MATYTIPFVDEKVDTSDPGSIPMSIGKAVAGIATLGGAALIAQRLINAGSQAAGSDESIGVV